MNTNELTIVIPAKNEALLIPRLLNSLTQQDYPLMSSTKVYVADAASTDGTPESVIGFRDRLNVSLIPGGLPAVGRNAGARLGTTPYVLFIDADVELADSTLMRRAVDLMRSRRLHCVTTNIACPQGSFRDRLLYSGNNLCQHGSRLLKPFSTGMFMLFDRRRFLELGGFPEQALYAEDYMLTKNVARDKFAVLPGRVITTNRRFKKMGHLRLMRIFLGTALHTWDDSYFLRDKQYWTA